MSAPEALRVAVVGAAGRMGREVLRALTPQLGFNVLIAADRSEVGKSCRELAGPLAPDIPIIDKLGGALDRDPVDVLVDFSHHSAAPSHAESALRRGISPVIGCTGISEADLSQIRSLTKEHKVAAMYVPNFAIGAVLMMKFSQMAAKWMPDVEVIELHHDRKEDAPSGTAMLTAQIISDARTSDPTRLPRPTIKAEGVRGGKVAEIPVHSVRLPGLLAHQEVLFGSPGELLTIRHDSTDRSGFMNGVRLAVREVRSLEGFVIGLDKILFR
ncbi:MAG TPA: 4-hydroxy-tetrahydrodipicolinate reductase [Fimbriimonas sp.]|nr:4-hydroxy-tetrahydrodipicolinate reductase [Fimbriimonas sp.]